MAGTVKSATRILICLMICLCPVQVFARTSAEDKAMKEAQAKGEECLSKALESFLEGKWSVAQANFQVAINNGIESDEIYYMYLLCQMNLKSYEKANSTCDIFLSKYEDSPLAEYVYYQKGQSLFAQDRLDFAAEAFSTCCLYYPQGNLYLQSFFKAGECFYNMGHADDAKIIYTSIVADYPGTEESKESIKRLQNIQSKKIPVWKDPQLTDSVNTSRELLKLKAKAAQVELFLMEIEGR